MITISSRHQALAWDPHNSHAFIATTEDGRASCYDARAERTKPVWSLHAHSKARLLL